MFNNPMSISCFNISNAELTPIYYVYSKIDWILLLSVLVYIWHPHITSVTICLGGSRDLWLIRPWGLRLQATVAASGGKFRISLGIWSLLPSWYNTIYVFWSSYKRYFRICDPTRLGLNLGDLSNKQSVSLVGW